MTLLTRFQTLYETILLIEGREDYIIQHQGDQLKVAAERDVGTITIEDLIGRIKALDPSPKHKNLQWLVNQYIDDNFRLEDADRVTTALTQFERKKSSLEKKDVNQHKTLSDLEDAVLDAQDVISGKQVAKLAKADAEKVFQDSKWLVVVPKTFAASNYYGANTKWCTTGTSDALFKSYSRQSRLYIIINKSNGKKFQFHAATSQLKQANDSNISPADLKSIIEYEPLTDFLLTVGFAEKLPKATLIGPKLLTYLKMPGAAAHVACVFVSERGRKALFDLTKKHGIDLDGTVLKALDHKYQIPGMFKYINVVRKRAWPEFEALLVDHSDELMGDTTMNDLVAYIDRYVHERSPGIEKLISVFGKKYPRVHQMYVDNVFDFDGVTDESDLMDTLARATTVAALLRVFNAKKLTEEQLVQAMRGAPVTTVLAYIKTKKITGPLVAQYLRGSAIIELDKMIENGYSHTIEPSIISAAVILTNLKMRSPEFETMFMRYVERFDGNDLWFAGVMGEMIHVADAGRWDEYETHLLDPKRPPLVGRHSEQSGYHKNSFSGALSYAAVGGHLGRWREMEDAFQHYRESKYAEVINGDEWLQSAAADVDGFKFYFGDTSHFDTERLKEYVQKYAPDWKFGVAMVKEGDRREKQSQKIR